MGSRQAGRVTHLEVRLAREDQLQMVWHTMREAFEVLEVKPHPNGEGMVTQMRKLLGGTPS